MEVKAELGIDFSNINIFFHIIWINIKEIYFYLESDTSLTELSAISDT